MSSKYAVLGSPIGHSKSPDIHSAAYRVLGLDWNYSKIEVKKGHLLQFLETLNENWHGFSVTAPLKEEAFRQASERDSSVDLSLVANTLLSTTSGWKAFNTDIFGIQSALANITMPNSISLIGTGATARSALVALATKFPAATFLVCGRNSNARNKLLELGKRIGVSIKGSRKIAKGLVNHDLVVTTLPARALDLEIMKLDKSWFKSPRGVLFDVAYDPWPSEAAQLWAANGLSVVSGIDMLIWQALAQLRIFYSGSISSPLPNEAAVLLAMRDSIGLI